MHSVQYTQKHLLQLTGLSTSGSSWRRSLMKSFKSSNGFTIAFWNTTS